MHCYRPYYSFLNWFSLSNMNSEQKKPELLDQMSESIRLHQYSIATELVYQTAEGLAVGGATTVDATEARKLFDTGGAVFVDVRNDVAWNQGHIPDAVHLEANQQFSRAALSKIANVNQKVIIYCAGPG